MVQEMSEDYIREETSDDYDIYDDIRRQEEGFSISKSLSESAFKGGNKKCSTSRYVTSLIKNNLCFFSFTIYSFQEKKVIWPIQAEAETKKA